MEERRRSSGRLLLTATLLGSLLAVFTLLALNQQTQRRIGLRDRAGAPRARAGGARGGGADGRRARARRRGAAGERGGVLRDVHAEPAGDGCGSTSEAAVTSTGEPGASAPRPGYEAAESRTAWPPAISPRRKTSTRRARAPRRRRRRTPGSDRSRSASCKRTARGSGCTSRAPSSGTPRGALLHTLEWVTDITQRKQADAGAEALLVALGAAGSRRRAPTAPRTSSSPSSRTSCAIRSRPSRPRSS